MVVVYAQWCAIDVHLTRPGKLALASCKDSWTTSCLKMHSVRVDISVALLPHAGGEGVEERSADSNSGRVQKD